MDEALRSPTEVPWVGGTPVRPPDALGQEVTLERLGGPCDGESLTHDRRAFTYTQRSLTGESEVTSLYQVSPRVTPRGLSFIWLYVGDR